MIQSTNKCIIFDLDGTLADSMDVGLDILNEMQIVDHKLTRTDYESVKNLTIPALFREFGVPLWRAPQIAVHIRSEITKRMHEVPLFDGMEKTIAEISKDHKLFVMSSNSLANVRKFLELHDIRDYFEQIYGGVGIFGKAKALNKVAKQQHLDKSDTYYVGDEVRDIVAAQKAGIHAVAVTWGFNGEDILIEQKPEFIARSPKDLGMLFTSKGPTS